jgi:hypothetical protein
MTSLLGELCIRTVVSSFVDTSSFCFNRQQKAALTTEGRVRDDARNRQLETRCEAEKDRESEERETLLIGFNQMGRSIGTNDGRRELTNE